MFVFYLADDIKTKMQSVSRNMHMADILCLVTSLVLTHTSYNYPNASETTLKTMGKQIYSTMYWWFNCR